MQWKAVEPFRTRVLLWYPPKIYCVIIISVIIKNKLLVSTGFDPHVEHHTKAKVKVKLPRIHYIGKPESKLAEDKTLSFRLSRKTWVNHLRTSISPLNLPISIYQRFRDNLPWIVIHFIHILVKITGYLTRILTKIVASVKVSVKDRSEYQKSLRKTEIH